MQVYDLFCQSKDSSFNSNGGSEWTAVRMKMRSASGAYIPYVGLLADGARQDIRVATFQLDQRGRFQSLEAVERSVYANLWEMFARANGSAGSPAFARAAEAMTKLELPYDENQ